jgi:serpin B
MLSVLCGIGPASSIQCAQAPSPVDGNTAFALDLYGRLKNGPGNLFFSPYSIASCLAMVYAGARGDTEREMAQVLRFDKDQQQLHSSFGELQRQLNEVEKQQAIQLSIANGLWAQAGHSFLPAFLEVAKGEYEANLSQVDFKTGAEAARGEINRWVAQKTKDKIRTILPPGSVTGFTRLVLANAIYFKGAWARPFDQAETSLRPFHLSRANQAGALLMHHFDTVRYMENSDFQAVELPYRGHELSMMVILPRQVDGCGQLEGRLTPALLSGSVAQMKQQRVEIFLPRFKLESGFDLKNTLAKMGMPGAFGPKADLSGMDGTRLLYISGVFHKAWGEVNEEGTEAAAATAATVATSAVMRPVAPPPVFRADHPFIFLIRDTRSGSLLFLGRLADPNGKG